MTFFAHDRVVRFLTELSDKGVQKKLWLATEGEFSTFVEAVEGLFTDTGLSLELDRSRSVYGPEIDRMFERLAKLLSKIDDNRYPEEIIEDPEMDNVRALSSEILEIIA